jgi:hypothetical protein
MNRLSENHFPCSDNIILIDTCTTNSILNEREYFKVFHENSTPLNTVVTEQQGVAKGSGSVEIQLENGTVLKLKNALFLPNSNRNLLSRKDINKTDYQKLT